jgi:hypothetical protein
LSTVAQRAAAPPDEPTAPAPYGDCELMPAFGGEKGRFGGRWALEEFTTDHRISVQHEPRRYPV